MGVIANVFQEALVATWNDRSRFGQLRQEGGHQPQSMFMDSPSFDDPAIDDQDEAFETRRRVADLREVVSDPH